MTADNSEQKNIGQYSFSYNFSLVVFSQKEKWVSLNVNQKIHFIMASPGLKQGCCIVFKGSSWVIHVEKCLLSSEISGWSCVESR